MTNEELLEFANEQIQSKKGVTITSAKINKDGLSLEFGVTEDYVYSFSESEDVSDERLKKAVSEMFKREFKNQRLMYNFWYHDSGTCTANKVGFNECEICPIKTMEDLRKLIRDNN